MKFLSPDNDRDEIKQELAAPLPQEVLAEDAYRYAAGLLWRDRHLLFIFAGLLATPGIIRVLLGPYNEFLTAFASLLTEGIRLGLLFYLTVRILSKKSDSKDELSWERYRQILTYGGMLWCISMLPSVIHLSSALAQAMISLVCFLSGLLLLFFFVPIARGRTNFLEILNETFDFTTFDPLMPVRVLLMPYAAMLFLTSVFSEPFPGTYTHFMGELFHGLGGILSCYLAVAFGLTFLTSQQEIPEVDQKDVQSVQDQAPSWMAETLHMNNGLICGVLALIVWTNNVHTLYSLPKSTMMQITSVTQYQETLTVSLEVHDKNFGYSRFHPMLFSLASEKQTTLARFPARMRVNGEQLEPDQAVNSMLASSERTKPIHIALDFDVRARAQDIKHLDDIYLWYAADSRIAKVQLHRENSLEPSRRPKQPMQYAMILRKSPSANAS
jgi:hypothetical protein